MRSAKKTRFDTVTHLLRQEGIRQLGIDGMQEYQSKYKEITHGYEQSDLKIYSSIDLEKFQPFKDWVPFLIENKEKLMPIIVHNMLAQDIFALNIYDILQQSTNSLPLLHLFEIRLNDNLYSIYKQILGEQGVAVVNAINWLASEEAANIAINSDIKDNSHESTYNFCYINNMLDISNSYLDCSGQTI